MSLRAGPEVMGGYEVIFVNVARGCVDRSPMRTPGERRDEVSSYWVETWQKGNINIEDNMRTRAVYNAMASPDLDSSLRCWSLLLPMRVSVDE